MPDPVKKPFSLPTLKFPALKLPAFFKGPLTLAAAVLVAAAASGVYMWSLNADLKSSTKILQGLRDEVGRLRQENQTHLNQVAEEKSRSESLSTEINSLKEENTSSTQKQEELLTKVQEAEKSLENQNQKVQELEKRLKTSDERIRRQKKASASLEGEARSARLNPGMTPEYLKLVENEWMSAAAKTEELKKDLDKTLNELSGQNQERSRLRLETATMHYNLAVILTQQENYPAAIREYEKVLETRPDDADSHYNLAILYDDHTKSKAKALDHYRQYIRISPASPESPRVREWIQQKEFETAMTK